MKKWLILMCLPFVGFAQHPKDSLLQNERSIDRPINLHGGQFRLTAGYALSSFSRVYDASGNVIRLSDDGVAYVGHELSFDFRYGISEFIEAAVVLKHRRQSQRSQQLLVASINGTTELSEVTDRNGLEDLWMGFSARIPLSTRKIDLIPRLGISLPVGDGRDHQPSHESGLQQLSPTSTITSVVYRYNRVWGMGVAVANVGGAFKWRGQQNAISLFINYEHALGEATKVDWQHQLVGGDFQYRADEYSTWPSDRLNYTVDLERQLAPWFDLSLQLVGEQTYGGWTESNGRKVSQLQSPITYVAPGFEVIVTPRIWLRERLFFPMSGKNREAPFSFATSLVYNVFPFNP